MLVFARGGGSFYFAQPYKLYQIMAYLVVQLPVEEKKNKYNQQTYLCDDTLTG